MNHRYCCYLKARAASAQSFTLWQQAKIEFTWQYHSIIACSCHVYMGVVFVHIPFVVNRAFSTTPAKRLQQHHLLFTMNCADCTFFVWRLPPARPSHPGHSTILLRLESLSSKCAKICTVAASNNRVHLMRPLYYCLFAPHIYMGVVLRAHPVRGESHIQRNASGEVATEYSLDGKLACDNAKETCFYTPAVMQKSLYWMSIISTNHKELRNGRLYWVILMLFLMTGSSFLQTRDSANESKTKNLCSNH